MSGRTPRTLVVVQDKPSVSVSPLRAKLEHRSNPMVEALSRTPRVVPIVLFAVLVVAGLVLRGTVGGVLLTLAAAFVGWLAFLVWRQLTLPERLFRCAVLVLIAALAIVSYASDGLLG